MKPTEEARLIKMSQYEAASYAQGYTLIAGADEAGRGPLAGPVSAACVILPKDCMIEGLNDSKKVSPLKREKLYDIIIKTAVSYGIGLVSETEIDEINILNATKLAMKRAIESMPVKPDILLIDALKLSDVAISQLSIIKGDALSISIAAASILAKVTRDRLMDEYDITYPGYGFGKHKGYGTAEHYAQIAALGACPIHRKTFLHI